MDNFRSGDTLNVCHSSDAHARNHRPSLIGLFSGKHRCPFISFT